MNKIKKLKEELNTEFDMKGLGKARKFMGMIIERNTKEHSLRLRQKPYLERLVSNYGHLNCKTISLHATPHFVSKAQCPKVEYEIIEMESVSYANVISSLMCAMISTRPNLCYVISLLSRYMSNPGKEY